MAPMKFTEMTDEGLVEAYWATRTLAANGANVRSRNTGRTLRHLDIIVAVARRRGLALAR